MNKRKLLVLKMIVLALQEEIDGDEEELNFERVLCRTEQYGRAYGVTRDEAEKLLLGVILKEDKG